MEIHREGGCGGCCKVEAGPEGIMGRPSRSDSNQVRSSALWRMKVVRVCQPDPGNKGGTA
ncbi:MAG: hypothetical protein K2K19_07890 [Acetatifactor sp.]|nr:hypothetical protein [Acetatifactor sp.]